MLWDIILYQKSNSASIHSSPLEARSIAVSFPIPVLAPVMMTVFPSSLALLRQTPPAKYRLMTVKLTPTNVVK